MTASKKNRISLLQGEGLSLFAYQQNVNYIESTIFSTELTKIRQPSNTQHRMHNPKGRW